MTEIEKLEKQLHLNILYAGMKAQGVNIEKLNSKLSQEEGELIGSLIAMAQTVAQLMLAKGYK